MLRPKKNRFLIRAFHFHTVRFDSGIVPESLMNNAAIKRVEWFQFDHISPAPNFLRGFHGFLDESVSCLGAVAAHIDHYFWRGWILLKEQPIGDVLQIGKRQS